MAQEINEANFETEVLKSQGVSLVDFGAPWCGPCKMITPIIEQLSKDFDGKAKIYTLNTDESPQVAGNFGITGIPTIIFFKNGQEADRVVGLVSKEKLTEKINGLL